jgi:hypothetical protein
MEITKEMVDELESASIHNRDEVGQKWANVVTLTHVFFKPGYDEYDPDTFNAVKKAFESCWKEYKEYFEWEEREETITRHYKVLVEKNPEGGLRD